MNQSLAECYLAALGAMNIDGPKSLHSRARLEADERQARLEIGDDVLERYLQKASLNDPLRKTIHLSISRWDVTAQDNAWTAGTLPRTRERRNLIYARLGIDPNTKLVGTLNDLFALDTEAPVVISDKFEAWYSPSIRSARGEFYYSAYSDYLRRKNWPAPALASLDQATSQVVERLTDPMRLEARQAKGLVVGYVQSGKTANFTGVIAKAIDAGYRLIIVLTGTIDVLRRQTQRRIDMELVGKENILRGADPTDADLMSHVDYQQDADWDEKFISFGFLPSSRNVPDIIRLTSAKGDYKSLKSGIVALEFEKTDRTKPLYDPVNLPQSSARIAIVKKNKAVLTKLVRDLRSLKTPRHEIPALIIDDESDQASVNTSDPETWKEGQTERTAINKAISQLLELLPRAQYVGYTATPFANVFIDPGDASDIFPKDFLISLQRPSGYMGVSDFHDLSDELEPGLKTVANSNEVAFVRSATEGTEEQAGEPKLQESLDAFILSGAIKLFREKAGEGRFRHHTMLVHQSVKQTEHKELAEEIRALWRNSAYAGIGGLSRLKELYLKDFLPVCRSRAGQYSFPDNFELLKPHIAATVSKIMSLNDPVMIVNGDKEMSSEEIDFDKRQVWRILVGGTKLSRGFTVEGLTVSYYRRKAKQADTLMQMGRWFGFRDGYQDLVRLYIGRAEQDGLGTLDLYEAFEAIVRDEEAFREQLRQYSELVDGVPQITPKEIPPLVSQHLPWLRPAAKNKMFNAELVVRRTAGKLVIPYGYPVDPKATMRRNYLAVQPVLAAAKSEVELVIPEGSGISRSTFGAWIGQVDSSGLLSAVKGIRWITEDYFRPEIAFLEEIASRIDSWVIIAPQANERASARHLPGVGHRTVFKRNLRPPSLKLWREPTDRKHRPAAEFVSGNLQDYGDPVLTKLRGTSVGAIMVYPISESPSELRDNVEPEDIVLALAWITPPSVSQATKVVQFRAKNSAYPDEPIVSVT